MFLNTPRIYAHKSSLDKGNFVLHDVMLNKGTDQVNLFKRHCPHRMYPLADVGSHVTDITCKFHNFKWNSMGTPLNNTKSIGCGSAAVGHSGLIFKDWQEPDHKWVTDLAKETELEYSHSFQGSSKGSWLWLMDAEADLLHIHEQGIHPFLSKQVSLDEINMDQGDGWILQTHPSGWWLYVFPYTFVEYGNPGMLMVNTVRPVDENVEFGFDWITQFYYNKDVDVGRRMVFETLENVFKEDVATAELQKGSYFPLMNAMNKYEDHCVHFGKWFKNSLKK